MDSSRLNRLLAGLIVVAGLGLASPALGGERLYLVDGATFPGKLWASEAGGSERLMFQREAIANPAYPEAVMKLGHVAVGSDQKIYYCSGLDGYVMHLLDGRREVLSFEFAEPVRDVACSDEEHVVYFSVVPTPQGDEPQADGKIYRRDLWKGQPTEVATVRQRDVGGAWRGNFAIRNRELFVATLEEPTRVFKLTATKPDLVATAAEHKISGFAWTGDQWLLAEGTGRIFRTVDFAAIEDAFLAVKPISDVSVQAAPRP